MPLTPSPAMESDQRLVKSLGPAASLQEVARTEGHTDLHLSVKSWVGLMAWILQQMHWKEQKGGENTCRLKES